ncbi:MAG: hypothetical protein AVDCRST_MAG33-442, partial [uncultured Thermomicrobiales bacterium]
CVSGRPMTTGTPRENRWSLSRMPPAYRSLTRRDAATVCLWLRGASRSSSRR